MSLAMRAKGFSFRYLRSRKAATATGFMASHARWYPPSPFTARMLPWRSNCAALRMLASLPRLSPSSECK